MVNFIDAKLKGDIALDLSRFEQKVKDVVLFAGAAAMAKAQYDEVKANAAGANDGPNIVSGTLFNAIYRVYSPEKSSDEVKTYRISWNKKKAPHGHLIEFGHWTKKVGKNGPLKPVWVPAHPFLRPAFDHIGAAITAGQNRMRQRLDDGVVEVAP